MENLILNAQEVISDPEFILSLLVFSAVVLLFLGGVSLVTAGSRVRRRLQTRVQRPGTATGSAMAARQRSGPRANSFLHKLEKSVTGKDDPKVSLIRQKLVQAGYDQPTALITYFLIRIGLSVVFPVGLLVSLPLFAGSLPPEKLFLIAMLAVVAGFYLPVLWVARKISSRQLDAREGFPDALDMLLVCVEAGLSLAAALNRVGAEIGVARPLLGEHFKLVALEMQAGKSREQALRNLADRIGIDEVRSLVTLLLQSDALGASISQSLRVHAEDMRRTRLLRAEEQANKLPAKMAIPLVCFILPCLISVIMTPVIIRIVRVLLPAGSNF